MKVGALIVGSVLFWYATACALDGTALVESGGVISRVNMSTAQWVAIKSNSDFNSYNNVRGPCFSPDGKRVAYSRYQLNTGADDGNHILIMDNDGGNTVELCKAFNSGNASIECSWADNGHVYWSEDGDAVYRVNVLTRQREQVISLSQMSGDVPSRIDNLKVSLSGTRGACMRNGSSEGSFAFDLVSGVSTRVGSGCQGTISPNGQLVTHNTTGGDGWSYHQLAYIRNYADKSVAHTLHPDNATTPAAAGNKRFVFHRFSHSSNDYIVYSGEDGLSGKGFVCNIASGESWLIGNCTAYDFWAGALPPPPVAAPLIVCTPQSLAFTSVDGAVPSARTISMTNGGIGTLGTLSLQGKPNWLSISVSGEGNSQSLVNTVNIANLSDSTYSATIIVSGGGASNSVSYTVSLTVGSSLAAPGGLDGAQQSQTSAALSWIDNSSNEAGFIIERKQDGGAWTEISRTAPNATTFADSSLGAGGTYTYRVAAFTQTEVSSFSSEKQLVLSIQSSITITSPVEGDHWVIGSTVHIQWSVVAVGSVSILYSLDHGDSWALITNSGSIAPDSSHYGNYPAVIPSAMQGDSVLIRVEEYGNSDLAGESGYISVSAENAVVSFGVGSMRPGVHLTSGRGGELVVHSANGSTGTKAMLFNLKGAVAGRGVATDAGVVLTGRAAGSYIVQVKHDKQTTRLPIVRR